MGYALLLDIGNTNIKIGLADHAAIQHSFSFPTRQEQTADSLGMSISDALRHANTKPEQITKIIASSVVPNLNPTLRTACTKYFGQELLLATEDLIIPLENKYEEPRQVGADRLVGAYAARILYPEPSAIICVDYGTATTFDCIAYNAYLGGLICPGVRSSAEALVTRTAKLPSVSLEVSQDTPEPGRSTSTSINYGFVFGFAAMTEGLCMRLKKNLPAPCIVLGTGGFAANLNKVVKCFDVVKPDLLLEGLRIMYTKL